ncbi:hypothetical protein CHUAL_003649 [Chamberlinius hualienensis]
MANVVANSDRGKALAESLQSDFKTLSNEAKRKHPPVKEAAEAAIVKIRNLMSKNEYLLQAMQQESGEILQPFILGCDTKNAKLVQICVNGIQRLIAHGTVSVTSADNVVSCLWTLMETGVEEVKLLQTILLLLNNGDQVRGHSLAKALALCLRLHAAKDSTTANAASATVRQLVSLVFDRLLEEDKLNNHSASSSEEVKLEELKLCCSDPPKSLSTCGADVYMLFQDLVQLINVDRTVWLLDVNEVSRILCLELLEEILTSFGKVFVTHRELSFLLKERVCPLIIKLFSPNIKHRLMSSSGLVSAGAAGSASGSASAEKPCYPITVRLLRIVSVLIHKYHFLLVTECEIFLSLIIKFLDVERPQWQRVLALGVLHKMVIQPKLITAFCNCYDSKPHSTKILRDIINALGSYVQSSFVSPTPNSQLLSGPSQAQVQGAPPSLLAGMPVGPGITPQPAFIYHGVWIPINVTFPPGTAKSIYLDNLERSDSGTIAEGYGISVSYAALLDVVRSVCIAIEGTTPFNGEPETPAAGTMISTQDSDNHLEVTKELKEQMVVSTWSGLLAALCLLHEASTDETISENILKALQAYARLTSVLGLNVPRDAFVTAMCKASLPPYYTLTVLTESAGPHSDYGSSSMAMGSSMSSSVTQLGQYVTEPDYRPQVVAVGTPLPTSSLQTGGNQGSVVLTAKNLQCMRSILLLAHCHGSILGTAWHLVLTTLQHLVWILGLKPSTGGSLKAGRPNDGANTVITTAVLADLPVLSAMLSRLFQSSQYLDDVALHHLVDALCRLSQESMELAYTNREPSLFAVAKLLETGLVNLPRLEVLWKPLTNHLLEVCRHPYVKMREWGVEAITTLVKEAFQKRLKRSNDANGGENAIAIAEDKQGKDALCLSILTPLKELSDVPHPDVRHKQLDCVLQILHSNGETLGNGWPGVLGVIGALSEGHGETLVRMAFQCLQLVVTDFLPMMPSVCLKLCVDTVARFGSQSQELNVSLSAVGLLWNVADHFHQNSERIRGALAAVASDENSPVINGAVPEPIAHLPPFERLWMSLYMWLAELCIDERPAIRKSAGQTLFSTISAHGDILHRESWQSVLWQVLFPLLDRVKSLSDSASADKMDVSGNILIHHSRNTARKQWAETQVLVLSGVARVFATRKELLQTLGDFPRAWVLLLEFIEIGALGKNDEVSLSALKSFQEILQVGQKDSDTHTSTNSLQNQADADKMTMWTAAWKIWCKIGTESTKECTLGSPTPYIPSQPFLTALLHIFPPLYRLVKPRFVVSDLQKFSSVVSDVVAVPIHSETSIIYTTPILSDSVLTPLQDATLQAVDVLQNLATSAEVGNLHLAVPQLLSLLLHLSQYASTIPKTGQQPKSTSHSMSTFYVPFGEKALDMAVNLYCKTAATSPVIEAASFRDVLKALRLPLSMKYLCPSSTTWKLAVKSLLVVLNVGLPIAHKHEKEFASAWSELASALEEFLFPKSSPVASRTLEEAQSDETIDCRVVQMIRDEILAQSKSLPKEFVLKIVSILDRGSIHSATASVSIEPDTQGGLREEFARLCFETLLRYSFLPQSGRVPGRAMRDKGSADEDGDLEGVTGKLAVAALLHRFQEVISKYAEDERLAGKCPLPRHRTSEISFVLKAVSTLTVALKKAPSCTVSAEVWQQLIGIYPSLVACITSTSPTVTRALREALGEYHELLKVPDKDSGLPNGV